MDDFGGTPPWLGEDDLAALTALRHELHRKPELSGREVETAARIAAELRSLGADRVETGLGGHGVAGVFRGAAPGPRVLLRCELDALPIEETGRPDWRSEVPGAGHLCGHDGHMVLVTGMARLLARQRPARGEVVLMYQPAEETGEGAAAVCADARYAGLEPDWAFAIHNMPQVARGQAAVQVGTMSCPSAGLKIWLEGRTAHASQPETGVSPAAAVARLIPALEGLSGGVVQDEGFRLVTLCHARVGRRAFGIAPGEAEMLLTLRARTDAVLAELRETAERMVRDAARSGGLEARIGYEEVFVACENTAGAVAVAERALGRAGIGIDNAMLPMRASEDFGGFGGRGELAMVFLGAGPGVADLHNPDFDFPDALIAPGVGFFAGVVAEILGFDAG